MNIVQGDLLKLAEAGEFNIIVHGANCWNTFGSGIAREIRLRYPAAAKIDAKTMRGDRNKLGTYTVMLGKQFNVVNAYTQYGFSSGEDVFEYEAFGKILDALAEQYPGCRFGFPKIGCGLARGDEKTIMTMLEAFAGKVEGEYGTVTVVEYAP